MTFDVNHPLDRRAAVKWTALTVTGLVVACKTPGPGAGSALRDGEQPAGAAPGTRIGYVVVTPEGGIRFLTTRTEIGQGITTGVAALVGEELDVDPREINVEHAGVGGLLPTLTKLDARATGGSSSIRGHWEAIRKSAAAAREMLVAAAAAGWSVPAAECTVKDKHVHHEVSGKKASYGSLAEKASTLPVPENPAIRTADFKYIGKSLPRIDVPFKVDGRAKFGIDTQIPGMLNATVVHCPFIGGKLKSMDPTAAKAEKGVVAVLETPYGVAIVADTFWHATNGAKKLVVEWEKGPNPTLSSESIRAEHKQLVEGTGLVAANKGNAPQAYAGAAKKVEAYYGVPFLAHIPLEPQNCTADVRADGTCEIWAPTQAAVSARSVAAKITGFAPEKIKVNVTLAGGGFGRRLRNDYVGEAVTISKAMGKPVKVLWTRPEEFIRGFHRPAAYHKVRAGIDAQGKITTWSQMIVGPSIYSWLAEDPVINPAPQAEADGSSVEGSEAAIYKIANVRVEWKQHESGMPVSWWRAVGYSQNGFITESVIDELAGQAGQNPLAFRLANLKDARHKAVLQLAADKAGWGTQLPQGKGRGLAIVESFGSICAQVAEVEVQDGEVRVTRITAAIDCGIAVNPALVVAQIRSCVIQALGAALYQRITIKDGAIVQKSLSACRLPTLTDTPPIDVHIVPSTAAPGGVGEPGLPPLAPAVCNAVFAAVGQRVRELPVKLS